jgi:hypothetical protein
METTDAVNCATAFNSTRSTSTTTAGRSSPEWLLLHFAAIEDGQLFDSLQAFQTAAANWALLDKFTMWADKKPPVYIYSSGVDCLYRLIG